MATSTTITPLGPVSRSKEGEQEESNDEKEREERDGEDGPSTALGWGVNAAFALSPSRVLSQDLTRNVRNEDCSNCYLFTSVHLHCAKKKKTDVYLFWNPKLI